MVKDEQTLINSIYEPKTLSEIMNNQQSYYETMYILRPGLKSLSFWTNGLEVPFHVMNDALKNYL